MNALTKLLTHSNQLRLFITNINKSMVFDTSLSYTYLSFTNYSLFSKPLKNKVKMESGSRVFDIYSYNLNNES